MTALLRRLGLPALIAIGVFYGATIAGATIVGIGAYAACVR